MKTIKKLLQLYVYIYALVGVITWVIAGILIRRGLGVNFAMVFRGGILISISLAAALFVFKKTWGNGVWNVIVAYLLTAPIPFIVRVMYENVFFRVVWVTFLSLGVYVIIYSLVVIAMKLKNDSMEKQLNELLKDRKDKTAKDE